MKSTQCARRGGSPGHTKRDALMNCGAPHPANECSVTPSMCDAAMPVEAVTATDPGRLYFCRSTWMATFNRNDLPVPVAPAVCRTVGEHNLLATAPGVL